MTQIALLLGREPDAEENDKDSWCTPKTTMDIVHRFWPEGIVLDPCSNSRAIALGYVRARLAWTIHDDCTRQPTWDVHKRLGLKRTTCWKQPPYSRRGAPIIENWAQRWDRGEMWETLTLVRLDTSTAWWETLSNRATSLVLFKDRIAHEGPDGPVDGSNICSAMFLCTRADPKVRHRALEAAVGDLGWCYRLRSGRW